MSNEEIQAFFLAKTLYNIFYRRKYCLNNCKMYIIVYFKISKLKNQIRIPTNILTRKQTNKEYRPPPPPHTHTIIK